MSDLRLISYSVDDTRAALHRGPCELWRREETDILYPQEMRCRLRGLPAGTFTGHHVAWSIGELADRSDVAVPTSDASERIVTFDGTAVIVAPDGTPTKSEVERVGNHDLAVFAGEGHYVEVDLAGLPIRVAFLCLPKGAIPEHYARKPEEADTPKYEWKTKSLPDLVHHLT